MNSRQRWRLRFVLVIIIAIAVALGTSLYWTQIIQGSSYAARAEKQYVKPSVTLFDRGTIYFQSNDGTRITAATVAAGYVVYMNPTLVTAPEDAYQVLSQYIKLDRADFLRRAKKPNDHYEELARRIDEVVANNIQSLGIVGINTAKETWRSYPGNTMESHTLGLIGENASSSIEGRYGLERSYEPVLTRPNISSSINTFAQIFGGNDNNSSSKLYGDIVTTLEPKVDAYVDSVLGKTKADWHPDEIGAIVMDPQTGEIIASSLLPSYDPNNTSAVKDVGVLSNALIEHVYEMGSIMKPLTMATGLDAGVIKPDSTYKDTGTMTLNGKKISNYDGKARGVIPMQQILSQSLNIGAATIALKVGAKDMLSYFTSFGLDKKTGIDLPNEASGLTKNLSSGHDIDIATASYGQGIAVSPIEMIRALAVLANGGFLVTPHVVKEIDYTDGSKKMVDESKTGPVLKAQTVSDVTDMLVKVVDISLRNGTIKREHYTVAAKTGTAQIPDHVSGGYYTDRYLHSFFGYFPAHDPKFIVFLYQIYPRGAQYASETLTEPFDEITTFLINYYNIPPDR